MEKMISKIREYVYYNLYFFKCTWVYFGLVKKHTIFAAMTKEQLHIIIDYANMMNGRKEKLEKKMSLKRYAKLMPSISYFLSILNRDKELAEIQLLLRR